MTSILEAPVRGRIVSGLCATCERAPTCTYPRDPEHPVIDCDDLVPLAIAIAPVTGPGLRGGAFVPPARAERGLCATCVRRGACTFPKPPGGVWHCEEFE